MPVKIFNQDFIDENISFDPSDSCNPIIYVSEEDIESKKRLEQLKLDKITLGKTYEQAKKDGMRTLLEDGLVKVTMGLTSIEEILATAQ